MEEPELVERARRGDEDAYEVLVRQYQEVAFRTAYLVTGDAQEAEEAAQEAFIKAFYALDRFRPDGRFRPWLLRIVTNEAHNRRRSAGRRVRLALRFAADRPSGSAAPSPEAAVLDGEMAEELLDGLAELDERDRVVIACRYFFEMSEAEMAVALDCRPGTVKSRLSRAMGRFRDQLGAQSKHADRVVGQKPGEQHG